MGESKTPRPQMQRRTWLWITLALLVVAFGLWFWRGSILELIEPHPGDHEASAKSSNLLADIRLMWETKPLVGTPDSSHGPNPRASTNRAINAASRVFNTVELIGKNYAEVVALLGDPAFASDSTYNFPFWPILEGGALVYRFDNGMCGWQFNVVPGEDGKVRAVEREWIH